MSKRLRNKKHKKSKYLKPGDVLKIQSSPSEDKPKAKFICWRYWIDKPNQEIILYTIHNNELFYGNSENFIKSNGEIVTLKDVSEKIAFRPCIYSEILKKELKLQKF